MFQNTMVPSGGHLLIRRYFKGVTQLVGYCLNCATQIQPSHSKQKHLLKVAKKNIAAQQVIFKMFRHLHVPLHIHVPKVHRKVTCWLGEEGNIGIERSVRI